MARRLTDVEVKYLQSSNRYRFGIHGIESAKQLETKLKQGSLTIADKYQAISSNIKRTVSFAPAPTIHAMPSQSQYDRQPEWDPAKSRKVKLRAKFLGLLRVFRVAGAEGPPDDLVDRELERLDGWVESAQAGLVLTDREAAELSDAAVSNILSSWNQH